MERKMEREREKGTEGRSKASVQASDNEFARRGLATSDSELRHTYSYRNSLDRPIFRSFARINAAIISHSVVYEQRAG